MEKKLTDEEWFEEYAKACKQLEDGYCEQLAYGGTSDAQTEKEIEFDRRLKDYVHRLQDENERLKDEKEEIRLFNLALQNGEVDMRIEGEMAKSFFNSIVQVFEQNGAKNFFTTTIDIEGKNGRYAFTIENVGGQTVAEKLAEQKAEIERLTREHERITYNKQEYLEWVDGFLRTHTVMKDRGEDYKMFDREWMCNTFWAKIDGSLDYIIDLENQRNELQKQVDELKTVKASYVNEIIEKAVKDTAKEIFTRIDNSFSLYYPHGQIPYSLFQEKIEMLEKKYGVEVE